MKERRPNPPWWMNTMSWEKYTALQQGNYQKLPKNGSVDMESQERKWLEPDFDGWDELSNYSSPSTTEKAPSAVSKRKTIYLNERAKPSISTTEKSQKASPYTPPVPTMTDEEYQQRVSKLKALMEQYRVNPTEVFYRPHRL